MNPVKVSIVVLNYNGISYTLRCIRSIRKNVYRDYELIVVDNGSTDGSVETLKNARGIRLICNDRNLGFAEGNNVGVRAARGRYICLLNNDTKPDKNWLKELVKAIESDSKIAICNPKIYDRYESSYYRFYGYGTVGLLQSPVFLARIDKHTKEYISSLTASGSCLFRKDLIGEPFDPDYFAYAEDAQLGWRANLMGYKVLHVPASVVFHEGGATTKRMNVPRDFFFVLAERNKMLNMTTLYQASTLLRLVPYFFVHAVFANMYDFRHIFSRINVYAWLMANFGKVLYKRKNLQRIRRVSDAEILKLMSHKLYDEAYTKSRILKFVVKSLNKLFYVYCWAVGLRTIDFHRIQVKKGIISVN